MSQSSWLGLRWLFSNIFKRFLPFFTSGTCLMSCLILCLKIMQWCHSCGKLTFLQSYMRDNMNYITKSSSFWQRSTLKSSMLTLHGLMVQCLTVRATSPTIINLCGKGIICGPSSIEIIISVSLRVKKMLGFDSWCAHCTSLSLRRQVLMVIKNSWRL